MSSNKILNLKIFFLSKLRKLFKSLGKKEKKVLNKIKYLQWKSRSDCGNLVWDENINEKEVNNSEHLPKKMAICISFFYDHKKIDILKQICKECKNFAKEFDVTIITNEQNKAKLENLEKIIKGVVLNFTIYSPPDLQDTRLLPWSHFVVMRKKIMDDSYTHFMYLEDDILLTKENILYWVKARNALKNYKLIPSFIRTEKNFKDNEIYAADQIEKNNLKNMPKVYSKKQDVAFVNLLAPYQGMYFFDKDLMKEHLEGPSSNPDFGHTIFNVNYTNNEVVFIDLMAKANIGLIYKDVPKGFFYRNVVPVDLKNKIVKDYCLIKHLTNKYTNEEKNTWTGNIKIKELFF